MKAWLRLTLHLAKKRYKGCSMTRWKQYRRTNIAEMRPYLMGEDVTHVSISEVDSQNGSPKFGDMIARNPLNHKDQWLVAAKYFADNFEAVEIGGVA